MAESQTSIHPSAIVDDGAQIGDGTKVWHFVHVMGGARIGKNCVLGQGVFISGNAVIGDRVKIQNNVSIYDGVVLEDDVFCGPSAVFTNVERPRSFVSRRSEYAETLVGKGATLGANCTILCGVKIGKYSMVGAGSVVTGDIGNHELVVGVPSRRIGWVCVCGERIEMSAGKASCERCERRYELVGEDLTQRSAEAQEK